MLNRVPIVDFVFKFQAYYALIICAQLKSNSSILVHPGRNPVAYAVISIAISMGCDVFIGINTLDEKTMFKKQFPNLQEENIGMLYTNKPIMF